MAGLPWLEAYNGESTDALEYDILAVEAREREVNNGGYSQFFTNSSKEFAPRVAR